MPSSRQLRQRSRPLRDRLAQRLANAALLIATPWYRDMVGGAISYGLSAAARDVEAGRKPPEPWQVLLNARSITEDDCECTNIDRMFYTGRDGKHHCEQCDGLVTPRGIR